MWNPTHVQVIVQKAKELIAKGKGGTNDAYVVVQLGKERYMTSIKEKCTDPVWHEECDLAFTDKSQYVEIIVYHRNFFGIDEFLGQIAIPLENFDASSSPKTKWYLLEGKKDKKSSKYRGKLEVTVSLVVNGNNLGGSTLNLSGKEKKGVKLKQLVSRASHMKLPHIPKRSFSLKTDNLHLPQHIQQWRERRLSDVKASANESEDSEWHQHVLASSETKPCNTSEVDLPQPKIHQAKENQKPIQRTLGISGSSLDVSFKPLNKTSSRHMSTPPENWSQLIIKGSKDMLKAKDDANLRNSANLNIKDLADVKNSSPEKKGKLQLLNKYTRRNTLQFSNDLNSSFQHALRNSDLVADADSDSDNLSDVEGASKDDLNKYKTMTKKQLVELVVTQQSLLTRQKDKISDLENYIDNLLVRVMDISPRILHISYKTTSPECVR